MERKHGQDYVAGRGGDREESSRVDPQGHRQLGTEEGSLWSQSKEQGRPALRRRLPRLSLCTHALVGS